MELRSGKVKHVITTPLSSPCESFLQQKKAVNDLLRTLQPHLLERCHFIRDSPYLARQFSILKQLHQIVHRKFYTTPSQGSHFLKCFYRGLQRLQKNLQPKSTLILPEPSDCMICYEPLRDRQFIFKCPFNHYYHYHCLQKTLSEPSLKLFASHAPSNGSESESEPQSTQGSAAMVKCLYCCVDNINVRAHSVVQFPDSCHSSTTPFSSMTSDGGAIPLSE